MPIATGRHACPATLLDILPFRDVFRLEMACQITKDSIHSRPGWTREFLLRDGQTPVGYGSVAVAGPWQDRPTVYEYFVARPFRTHVFELFEALLAESGALQIDTQSNQPLLTAMLHVYARDVKSESIVFDDRITTRLPPPDRVRFRAAGPGDEERIPQDQRGADYLLESDGGEIAATGGLLWHYNRPYGDIYMHVAENWRRRGLGAYLVQEIKRSCYERGSVPAARCNVDNVASRKTLQKAGFVPCAHILTGTLRRKEG